MQSLVVRSSLATAASLFGGILIGMGLGILVHGLLAGSPEYVRVALAAVPALAGTIAGGAAWGNLLARIHRLDRRRLSIAGAICFGPLVIAVGFLLAKIEPVLIEQDHLPVSMHVLFTILFVPSTFLIAGIGGLTVAIGARLDSQRLRFFFLTGLIAAAAFLVVDILMDVIGWRVGAPGAAERATMITVMFLGALAAALSAGAVLGRLLLESKPHEDIAA